MISFLDGLMYIGIFCSVWFPVNILILLVAVAYAKKFRSPGKIDSEDFQVFFWGTICIGIPLLLVYIPVCLYDLLMYICKILPNGSNNAHLQEDNDSKKNKSAQLQLEIDNLELDYHLKNQRKRIKVLKRSLQKDNEIEADLLIPDIRVDLSD